MTNIMEVIIAEDLPNLGKDTDIEIQETKGTPVKNNKSKRQQKIL